MQGMQAWRLKESNTGEPKMHNSERNKLQLIREFINRQYVNMALFNATKEGSSTSVCPDQNDYDIQLQLRPT